MARSRYKFVQADAPYFLTDTIIDWLPVFKDDENVRIVLGSLQHMREKEGLKLVGYVIMPEHMHWIGQHEELPQLVKRFKSYTARLIIDRLQNNDPQGFLTRLTSSKKSYKTDATHQLWQEGSHPQLIHNNDMLRQKLNYIHHNPVRRDLVAETEDWEASSARNYLDLPGLIEIDRLA